jgi:LysM repeat protein
MKLLSWCKTFIAAFLSFIFKPLGAVFAFFFLKALAKIYLAYFSFAKKVGWSRLGGSFFSFLLSRKTAHIILAVLAVMVGASGVLSQTVKAKSLFDNAGKTLIARMIVSDFENSDQSYLIEEIAGMGTAMPKAGTQYLNDGEAVMNQMTISTTTAAIQEIALADLGLQNGGMLIKPEVATTEKSKKTRKSSVKYAVQPGDTISIIAANFDVSINTILWENNLSATSLIRPGDTLVILPSSGITYKVAKGETLGAIANKFGVDANDVLTANNLPEDSKLSLAQILFIPGGKKIYYAPPTSKVASAYNPIDVIKGLLSPSKAVAPAGKMLWPTVGHIITQYFSWKHKGLDIANKLGTPVYAAESGTIIDAGWSTAGYGNKVDIDHGGGIITRYGHATKLLVRKGDVVKKGDVIMLMGSTGRSTGPHLHFEVRIKGKTYNPLDYLR